MNINTQQLLELLPAIHRIRDAEIAAKNNDPHGPLEDLLSIIAEQFALLEENVEQSYDDLFIETCAEELTPYIGDLVGYQSLHGVVPEIASPREEVAHTIALRRRKGTVVMLEQLARDVTGWPARAVEFFQHLSCSQYINHPRVSVLYSPDFRNQQNLDRIGSAFNTAQHTIDVRRVSSNKGRFNIPNIGLFLWRIQDYSHTLNTAVRLDNRRYFISPLAHPLPLFSSPTKSNEGFISQLSTPNNIPEPLSRRQLHNDLDSYYGFRESIGEAADNTDPSIVLYVGASDLPLDQIEIARDQIRICNLSDDGSDWAHSMEPGIYGIDPELGRLALPPEAADSDKVLITYHRGFSADMGGGEYERVNSFTPQSTTLRVPNDHPSIEIAISALGGAGVVEITDNGRYEEENLNISIAVNSTIEIRATNGRYPHIALTGPLSVSGEEGSRFSLNGCLISGDGIEIPETGSNVLGQMNITHCSLVPGSSLDEQGDAVNPASISIQATIPDTKITVERSITGPLRATPSSQLILTESIVDATANDAIALADIDNVGPGATLKATASTIVGKVHVRAFDTVSNCILFSRLENGDTWNAPVWVERKQTGCIRFSFLPFESIVPRRFQCHPESAENALSVSPKFTSLRFGEAAYGQLASTTPNEIFRGSDDESEMGAFHHLYAPQRESNLRIRLREYLRVGLEAGLFYES